MTPSSTFKRRRSLARGTATFRLILAFLMLSVPGRASDAPGEEPAELARLKALLLDQQSQIQQLRQALDSQQKMLAEVVARLPPQEGPRSAASGPAAAPAAALQTDFPVSAAPAASANPLPETGVSPAVVSRLEESIRNIGGFHFSGDFIYVFDAQARAGNAVAPALQNLRSRYRVRWNVDKTLSERFQFHLQLSTGSLNNQLTVLQDFGGVAPKSPFSIGEAWVAFRPNKSFTFRVGRMEEAYMDGSRYLIDENLRLNGFEQLFRVPINGKRGILNGLFNNLEVRAGEYILTNPNIVSVPANSPYVAAGYPAGSHVGAADLFHPGVTLRGDLNETWRHSLTMTMQIYRNANQIQLASTAAGIGIPSDAIGVVTSTPLTGSGNATTTPGGALFAAPKFRIAHVSYRADTSSLVRIGGKAIPAYFELQASRNVGAHKLRDGVMGSASFGEVHKAGDVRALYLFTIKDANSMISQITDDDLGTITGVNLAVHGVRVDVGLTRFLQWQNMFYLQHEKSASNPANNFFVPVQRGTNPTFRYFGQLLFVF